MRVWSSKSGSEAKEWRDGERLFRNPHGQRLLQGLLAVSLCISPFIGIVARRRHMHLEQALTKKSVVKYMVKKDDDVML